MDNGVRQIVLFVLVALMLAMAIGAYTMQVRSDNLIFLEGCVSLCDSRHVPGKEYCECVTWCCDAYEELEQ